MNNGAKRGKGRPSGSVADITREITKRQQRWTVEEVAQIQTAAEIVGESESEFVREAALARASAVCQQGGENR